MRRGRTGTGQCIQPGQDISADGTSVIATLSRTHALLAMASKCYNSNALPMVESTLLYWSVTWRKYSIR